MWIWHGVVVSTLSCHSEGPRLRFSLRPECTSSLLFVFISHFFKPKFKQNRAHVRPSLWTNPVLSNLKDIKVLQQN